MFALMGGGADGTIHYLLFAGGQQAQGNGNIVVRGKILPDPEWQQGHPDVSKQGVKAICDLKHCTPSGEHVVCTVDQAGETKIWQVTF